MKKAIIFLSLGLLPGLSLAAGSHPRPRVITKVAGPARKGGGVKAKAPVHPINLNSATLTELMQLPKVGTKTAERIVAWRKAHGGFRRPEELMHVKGIGEKGFQRLKPYLQVSGNGTAAAPVRK